MVIGYAYPWRHEHRRGHEEGRKDRPCAVVALVESAPSGMREVLVVPITHRRPDDSEVAIELLQATKRRLGLDADRSWIVCDEVNRFVWPGYDLRPVPRSKPRRFAYGFLPPGLFAQVKRRVLGLARMPRLAVVQREP